MDGISKIDVVDLDPPPPQQESVNTTVVDLEPPEPTDIDDKSDSDGEVEDWDSDVSLPDVEFDIKPPLEEEMVGLSPELKSAYK